MAPVVGPDHLAVDEPGDLVGQPFKASANTERSHLAAVEKETGSNR